MAMTRLAPLLFLTGCVIDQNQWLRPRDLSPVWLVDRLRILAVVAEPPEVEPGDLATFTALVPGPADVPDQVRIWLACPPVLGSETTFAASCSLDPSALSDTATVPDGFIGLEPGLPPSWRVPDDALDGLAPEDEEEGAYATIQVMSLPSTAIEDLSADIDFTEVETGTKRLVVSRAQTPNANPWFDDFRVEGVSIPEGTTVEVDPNQPYEIEVVLPDAAIETYLYVNSQGFTEERIEEPYVAWYADGGEIDEHFTLHPYLQSSWVSPASGSGSWWAVGRDRRGGMTWLERSWTVR